MSDHKINIDVQKVAKIIQQIRLLLEMLENNICKSLLEEDKNE